MNEIYDIPNVEMDKDAKIVCSFIPSVEKIIDEDTGEYIGAVNRDVKALLARTTDGEGETYHYLVLETRVESDGTTSSTYSICNVVKKENTFVFKISHDIGF